MDSFIAARLVGPKRARRDGLEISPRRVVARLTGPFRRLGNRSPNAGSPFRRLGTHFRKSACAFRHLGNHFRKSACTFRHLGNHFRIPFELSDISETISGSPLELSDVSETISGSPLALSDISESNASRRDELSLMETREIPSTLIKRDRFATFAE